MAKNPKKRGVIGKIALIIGSAIVFVGMLIYIVNEHKELNRAKAEIESYKHKVDLLVNQNDKYKNELDSEKKINKNLADDNKKLSNQLKQEKSRVKDLERKLKRGKKL